MVLATSTTLGCRIGESTKLVAAQRITRREPKNRLLGQAVEPIDVGQP